eukprot:TRINITY_DN31832_c0_g1_i1.p2 TRINITY_DN31832_c0_g1~~TRINITY_DN31832_c0_g1_i1.p2  ORF type:complete len:318 (+),score=141.83 TRINITY_DN31832_c0_g1_i1:22-954(+)
MSKNTKKFKSSKGVVIKQEDLDDDKAAVASRLKRPRSEVVPSEEEYFEIKEEPDEETVIKAESDDEGEPADSDGPADSDVAPDSDAAPESPDEADLDAEPDHQPPAKAPRLEGRAKRKQPVPTSDSDDGDDEGESGDDDSDSDLGEDEFGQAELKAEEDSEVKPRVNLFAAAVADILGAELPDDKTPILAKSKKKNDARRKEREIKKERRKAKEEALARKLLSNRDHVVPDHSNAEYEKKLKKIATRGVVQLFNAITKQQKQDQELADAEPKKVKTIDKLSKEKFLELLQKAPTVKAKSVKTERDEEDDD